MEGGADRFQFLAVVKKGSNFYLCGLSHHIFIKFDTVCTAPFVSVVFLKFWDPMKKCPPYLLRALISDK